MNNIDALLEKFKADLLAFIEQEVNARVEMINKTDASESSDVIGDVVDINEVSSELNGLLEDTPSKLSKKRADNEDVQPVFGDTISNSNVSNYSSVQQNQSDEYKDISTNAVLNDLTNLQEQNQLRKPSENIDFPELSVSPASSTSNFQTVQDEQPIARNTIASAFSILNRARKNCKWNEEEMNFMNEAVMDPTMLGYDAQLRSNGDAPSQEEGSAQPDLAQVQEAANQSVSDAWSEKPVRVTARDVLAYEDEQVRLANLQERTAERAKTAKETAGKWGDRFKKAGELVSRGKDYVVEKVKEVPEKYADAKNWGDRMVTNDKAMIKGKVDNFNQHVDDLTNGAANGVEKTMEGVDWVKRTLKEPGALLREARVAVASKYTEVTSGMIRKVAAELSRLADDMDMYSDARQNKLSETVDSYTSSAAEARGNQARIETSGEKVGKLTGWLRKFDSAKI